MMVVSSNRLPWRCFHNPIIQQQTSSIASTTKSISLKFKSVNSPRSSIMGDAPKESKRSGVQDLLETSGKSQPCPCCARRSFLGIGLGAASLLPISSSFASNNDSSPLDTDPMEELNRLRPPRPDWYEELYASAMDKLMKSYEAEVAAYKSPLFDSVKGKANKILEIGVGTGPNLKYYADYPGVEVIGVDPNRKMEKYVRTAAENAGLPLSKFTFMPGIAEALPVNDASVDAVIGTLVLCSVADVDRALQEVKRVLKPGGFYVFVEHVAAQDGTFRRFLQGILDPLQQTVADGCHLTRNTASHIARAGFADVDVNQASLSSAYFINPHVYGIALK